jgi:hypothetical protein
MYTNKLFRLDGLETSLFITRIEIKRISFRMSCVNPWFCKQAGIDAKVVDCMEAEEQESIELLVICRNIGEEGRM